MRAIPPLEEEAANRYGKLFFDAAADEDDDDGGAVGEVEPDEET